MRCGRPCNEYLEHGFPAIKFGWGAFGHDLELDIALVAGRAGGGRPGHRPDGRCRLVRHHADQPFRPRSLRDWIRLVGEAGGAGHLLAGGFPAPGEHRGYCARSATPAPPCGSPPGSSHAGYAEFERLAVEGGVDVLQPDLSRCGGLTVGKQIADLATRRQINCVPHAWLTDLLKAASLHLNAYLMDAPLPGVQRLHRLAAEHPLHDHAWR